MDSLRNSEFISFYNNKVANNIDLLYKNSFYKSKLFWKNYIVKTER